MPKACDLVYIGSEIPIPGGSREAEEPLSVTKAEAFEDSVRTYRQCFKQAGLRQMVEDGIAILKVGPALTYSLREACFALCQMEKELVPETEQSHFMEILDQTMLHQYIPNAYPDVRDGKMTMDPKDLVMSGVAAVMMDYEFATIQQGINS